jgi:SSS family solute:Na+ symporter/sodium/proline symporter
MVAGRRVSALFLAGTLVCTWIGSGSLFGGAGRAFRNGFSALWMSAGAWLGIVIVYFLAHRVRRISQYTVPDILETRYTPAARLLGTLAIVIAYLTIASYQFIGGGRLLFILTGLDPLTGRAITAGLVVVYTIFAGMLSIVALDLINGLMITSGVLIALPFTLKAAGGISNVTKILPPTHFTVFGTPGVAPAIGLCIPPLHLLLGESSMYQKFMSARDEKTARRAVVGMVFGVIFVESALVATAVFGAALYWNDPSFVFGNGQFATRATETIILQIGRYHLPFLAGIFLLTGSVAIIFSTANTFLMIPSTSLARDIYQRFIHPHASENRVVRFQRIMILLLAIIAFAMSSFFESILDMALYAYTMVGAAITPALLTAFLWRRVTELAGTLSIAFGMAATILFAVLHTLGFESVSFGFFELPLSYDYIIYPAALVSVLSLFLISYFTSPSNEQKWRPFWG